MRIHESLNHLALPLSHSGHIDAEALNADSELLAAPNIVGELRRMNDIFTRQTCDVRAGSADILAFHHRNALSPSCKGPGQQFRAGAATKDNEIVNFRLSLNIHVCSPAIFRY